MAAAAGPNIAHPARPWRLAYFVSHPIQYQAPLLRQIAAQTEIDLSVYFTTDFSVRGYRDEGFGVDIAWDIPLLSGYRYEILPKRMLKNAHHTRQISSGIYRRLRQGRFDAVWLHGYSTYDSLQALLACRSLRIPVLLRTDSNLYDRDRSPLKLLLKKAFFLTLKQNVAGILACGSANRRYWEHYLGRTFPIFDMPYAVDNDFFQRQAAQAAGQREKLRAELGLHAGRPVILYASKLQSRKRCIDLVEAFLRLDPKLARQPYLLIVGDGQERSAIESRISGNRNILMLGFRNQTELPRFFDLCDLFVLPSVHEPWGLVVNEVMNAGRAVIVSDQVGCQPDLVHEAVNGCVFPALHIESLTAALERALLSPETLAKMGAESLGIIARYSFDRDVATLHAALGQIAPRFQRSNVLPRASR